MQNWCCVIEQYEAAYNPYYEKAVYWTPTTQRQRKLSSDSTNNKYGSFRQYESPAKNTTKFRSKSKAAKNSFGHNYSYSSNATSSRPNMQTLENAEPSDFDYDDEELTPLRCWECNVNFTSKHYLYKHLFHHIKQPYIVLDRVQLPSIKITLKSKSDNSFEIISSPTYSNNTDTQSSPLSNGNISESTVDHLIANLADEDNSKDAQEEGDFGFSEEQEERLLEENNSDPLGIPEGEQESSLSPSFTNVEDFISGTDQGLIETPTTPTSDSFGGGEKSSSPLSNSQSATDSNILNSNSNSAESNVSEYGSIPGAEPTPPPDPSPDYPKIRIKTTGLLKDPEEGLTITEITDDNPDGDPNFNRSSSNNSMWTTPSLEDPLKLPDNDDNILSLFNNNDRAKDLGFHSSDSEYISLDKLEDRNRGAMQLYNPQQNNQNPLDSLTGLPMQALAQQVSRLQPSGGGNGLHQQNVLINIQQFPSGPPQPSYQPPPMYPHYPPQPMHQPYQYHSNYRPPNPMYYPPQPPGYPPQHMPPPPQPQMPQMGHQPPVSQPLGGSNPMGQPPMQNNQMPPTSQPQNGPMGAPQAMQQQPPQQNTGPYRQPMSAPRQTTPRPNMPGARMPNGPRQPIGQRQPMTRHRAPMVRPRAPGTGMSAVRTVRPRMANPSNGVRPQNSPVKRTPEQIQQMQAKKKKFDLLTPDKDDDDCQVICMQPKNTDGGLPQIESVQGGTSEPAESSIMHLSDSITLSVRNPPPKPAEPKKSDAKAVANILATRGITVTATAKPKEKPESPQKSAPSITTPLNLNGAVSILPANKTNGSARGGDSLPTVDLTDDTTPSAQPNSSPSKQRPGLPFRCDLCPAQYPNAVGLKNHRQTYHKTNGGICDLGIPLINLKTPGIIQKLSSIGINNYIPVPSSEGNFALPIISTRNPGNVAAMGATQMLNLGPVRAIPKPQNNVNAAAKQLNTQKS